MGIRVSAMPSAVTRRRGLSGGEGVRHPLLTWSRGPPGSSGALSKRRAPR